MTEYLRKDLADALAAEDVPRFHADQIFTWFYQRRAADYGSMTTLSKSLRERLAEAVPLRLPEVLAEDRSADGTRKWLLGLADGKTVECVLMPVDDRWSLCVSSQVGCRLGCRFCTTGGQGYERDLTAGEIVGEVVVAGRNLAEGERITNVVFMGMGEPLDNYDAVTRAIRILYDGFGLNLSSRRVTVSTAGLVPGIERLGREADLEVSLAVSLNAPTDAIRGRIMPIAKKYPLDALLAACRAFPMRPRRRITMEYVMLKGINDRVEHARQLAKALEGVRCMVNLIRFNGNPADGYEPPEEADVLAFQETLRARGYRAIIRVSRGADIRAACGQLRSACGRDLRDGPEED